MSRSVRPPEESIDIETPLWEFALGLWREPATAEAALALQSRGWTVSRLLVAAFCASQGQLWDGWESDDIRQWRQASTETLRGLRKAIPKDRSDLGKLRQALAEAELNAEQVELGCWYRQLIRQPPPHTPPQNPLRLLARNLAAAGEVLCDEGPVADDASLLARFAQTLVPAESCRAFMLELQTTLGLMLRAPDTNDPGRCSPGVADR